MAARLKQSSGQATIELLGALPAAIVVGLVCFQLLAVGHAAVLAGAAAEAGALALAGGASASDAALAAVPGARSSDLRTEVDGGKVRVELRPSSPIRAVGDALVVEARASVRAP